MDLNLYIESHIDKNSLKLINYLKLSVTNYGI